MAPVWGVALCPLREDAPFVTLPLTKGYSAMISPEDYGWLIRHKWYANVDKHTVYANRRRRKGDPRHPMHTSIHRDVVEHVTGQPIPEGYIVDHINHNGLDCRRGNLRINDRHANNINAVGFGIVQYRGVSMSDGKFRARILHPVTKDRISLGRYETAEEAARAYDLKALELHGVFASINFTLDHYEQDVDFSALMLRKETYSDVPF